MFSKMKNKRFIPIVGIIVGFIFGLFFEIQVWSIVRNSSTGIVNLPVSPSGGVPFGPGIITIMTAGLGGSIGVVISMIREDRKHK